MKYKNWFIIFITTIIALATSAVFTTTLATLAASEPSSLCASDNATAATDQICQVYLPRIYKKSGPIPPLPPPLPPPTPAVAISPTNWISIQADLQAQGLTMSFNKIGFHTGYGGNTTGLDQMLAELDAAGVPFFLKSVDDASHLYYAQQLAQASGVPHTLVWRRSGNEYDVPNYNLPPEIAAQQHWALHKAAFPPELDPSLVWIETVNEVDKNRIDWLADFAIATAQLAMNDGFKWAAFSWSSGEPEPEDWERPKMLQFLQLAAAHPSDLAVAVHEYSFITDTISSGYPWLVGRFQKLFRAVDKHGIGRPTVIISEWGWSYQHVPTPAEAMADIRWASWLYAAYPQVKGAATWYLGCCFGGVADQTQQLIAPVGAYSRSSYFIVTPGIGQIDETLFIPDPPTATDP
ncbi:MAG: hypothetical protein WAM60_20615 [Candidatus Promineifilaceae bacterium]